MERGLEGAIVEFSGFLWVSRGLEGDYSIFICDFTYTRSTQERHLHISGGDACPVEYLSTPHLLSLSHEAAEKMSRNRFEYRKGLTQKRGGCV